MKAVALTKSMKAQHGFTMIELIMVIVILGILSAFALPRFADLGADARRATLRGAYASMRSAAAIAHSSQVAAGNPSNANVLLDGINVTMINGYPTANAAGIFTAANLSVDFTTTGGGAAAAAVLTVRVAGASTPATCSFTYTSAATLPAGSAPVFGVLTTASTPGC